MEDRDRQNLVYHIRELAEATKKEAIYRAAGDTSLQESAKHDRERHWEDVLRLIDAKTSRENTVDWLIEAIRKRGTSKKEALEKMAHNNLDPHTAREYVRILNDIAELDRLVVTIVNYAYDGAQAERGKDGNTP